MNLPMFDQTREKELSTYGEAVRLSNELRYRPSGTRINILGEVVNDSGRLWGFDIETAEYSKLLSFFSDTRVTKRSASLIAFVNRILAIRFPNEYARDKTKIEAVISKREFELIQSEAKNEVEWAGCVGYQNMVRLDGSLTNKKLTVIRKGDKLEIRSKL